MKILLATVLSLVMLSALRAENIPDRIVGEWNMVRVVDGENQMDIPVGNPDFFAKWFFAADGNGKVSMGKDGKREEMSFAWKRDDSGLTMTAEDGSSPDTVSETYNESGDQLTLTKSESDVIILHRPEEKPQ